MTSTPTSKMPQLRGCYNVIYCLCLIWIREIMSECTPAEAPSNPQYFYPYGTVNGDTVLSQTSDAVSGENTLAAKFVLSKKRFSSFFVSENGLVSLGTAVSGQIDTIKLPHHQPLIAAYWSDIKLTNSDGAVFYRATTEATVLQRATSELRLRFATPLKFTAKAAAVITWKNVTHVSGDCMVSTFQAVLVTDGRYSFVTLNYAGLRVMDGNTTTPLVGINVDSGNTFTLPGSGFPNVTNLVNSSNVGTDGVWSFRVDTQPFITTLCSDTDGLSLSPPMASPQGGTLVRLSGPCLTAMSLRCKVGGKSAIITHLPPHGAQVFVPALWRLGTVKLELSTDGGSTYPHTAQLLLGLDPVAVPIVTRTSAALWDFEKNNVTVTWDAEAVDAEIVNVFFASYKINSQGDVDELLFPLAVNETNDGSVDVAVNGLPLVTDETLNLITFGSVLIKQSEGKSLQDEVLLYSDMHVAMWFVRIFLIELVVRNRLAELSGNSANILLSSLWGDLKTTFMSASGTVAEIKATIKSGVIDMCVMWRSVLGTIGLNMCQTEASEVKVEKPGPCAFEQSQSDPTWMDYTVRWHGAKCQFSSALSCTIPTMPETSGASLVACYHDEAFMKDGVPTAMPISAHPDGLTKDDGSVVTHWAVDHFLKDVEPRMFCCVWKTETCVDNYKKHRPAQNCDQYKPPGQGGGGGDPHFVTFDGFKYTFNGIGEYILTEHEDGFQVVARTQQRKPILASQVTSVAMKTFKSVTIEVRASIGSRLELLVSGVIQTLTGVSKLNFRDATCHLTFDGLDVTSVETVFQTGESVKVTEYDGALQYIIIPIAGHAGKLSGLLGDYDGQMENDLVSPQNKALDSVTATAQEIHAYALNWTIVTSQSNLFTYPTGEGPADMKNDSFVPIFPNSDMPVPDVCGTDEFCTYDFNVTNDMAFANATRKFSAELRTIKDNFNSGRDCDPLPTQMETLNTTLMRVGVVVHVQCPGGYAGSVTRRCLSNLTWSGSPSSCTRIETVCDNFKCKNNGTCKVNNDNKPVCNCKSTFIGSHCEDSVTDPKILIIVGSVIGGVLLVAIVGIVVLICKTRPPLGDRYNHPFKDAFPDYASGYSIPVFRGSAALRHTGLYESYSNHGYNPYGQEKRRDHHRHKDDRRGYPNPRRYPHNSDRPWRMHNPRNDRFPPSPYPYSDNEDSIDKIYRGEVPDRYKDSNPQPDYETQYSSHIDQANRRKHGGDRRDYRRRDDYNSSYDRSRHDRRHRQSEPPPPPPLPNPNW